MKKIIYFILITGLLISNSARHSSAANDNPYWYWNPIPAGIKYANNPNYLNFSDSNFSLKKTGDSLSLEHKWSKKDGKYEFSQSYSLSDEGTFKWYYNDQQTVKFKNPANDKDKIQFNLYKFSDKNFPYPAFSLIVEQVSVSEQYIVSLLWTDQIADTVDKGCVSSKSDPRKSVQTNIIQGTEPEVKKYEAFAGNLEGIGEGLNKGFCGYSPFRVKNNYFGELNHEASQNSPIPYYIYHLYQYLNDNGPQKTNISGGTAGVKPTADKIKACNKPDIFLDKPLTYYPKKDSNGKVNPNFDLLEKFKAAIIDGADDKSKIKIRDSIDQNPDLITKKRDLELYRMFYRSNLDQNKKYVDQGMDDNYVQNFLNMYLGEGLAAEVAGYSKTVAEGWDQQETTVKIVGGGIASASLLKKLGIATATGLKNALASGEGVATSAAATATANVAGTEAAQLAVAIEGTSATTAGYVGNVATAATTGGQMTIAAGTYAGEVGAAAGGTLVTNVGGGFGAMTTTVGTTSASGAAATGGFTLGTVLTPIIFLAIAAVVLYVTWSALEQHWADDNYRKWLERSYDLYVAASYMHSNVRYQSCAETWNETQAENYKSAQIIEDAGKENINKHGNALAEEDICPSAAVLVPSSWFRASLCGLGVALWKGGQKLNKFAKEQLIQVIGVKHKGGY